MNNLQFQNRKFAESHIEVKQINQLIYRLRGDKLIRDNRAVALRFDPDSVQRSINRLDMTAAYAIGAVAAYWLIERTSAFFA